MPDKEITSNKLGYDQWASFYDHYPNPTVATDERLFSTYWSDLRNKRVLEIGCGTGRNTMKLLRQQNRVVALDLSSEMMNSAKVKCQGDVVFINSDFFAYASRAEEPFDTILVSLVLEHIQDLQAFFKKAFDLLRSSGAIYISEIHPSRTADGVLAHFKNPGTGEEIHLDSHAHSEESILAEAARAGFKMIATVDGLGDENLAKIKPSWSRHVGIPLIKIWVFHRDH